MSLELRSEIEAYYYSHFDELRLDKQFHLSSRLAAWKNSTEAKERLGSLRQAFGGDDVEAFSQVRELLNNPKMSHVNAADARRPYFETYPFLAGLHLSLFRLRHLKFIYNLDLRDEFLTIYPISELHDLADALENDEDALMTLSTYAINVIYLIRFILYPLDGTSSQGFNERVYSLGLQRQATTPEQIQLHIYLYTHCIIGESNFYLRPTSEQTSDTFKKMLADIAELIINNYDYVHLDNKFEYLVSCRIVGFEPPKELSEKIEDEALRSISQKGTFLIDKLNLFPQLERTDLGSSEHRNVLYIMSGSNYPHQPHLQDT